MDGYTYNDGGRAAAGFKGSTGDCVVRSIAIATGKPYIEVYDTVNELAQDERPRNGKKRSNARNGVWRKSYQRYLESLGWEWVPTMTIGSGCKVHLVASELPSGRIICRLSKHLCAVIDGVIHDTFDSRRDVHTIESDHGQDLKPGQLRNQNGVCSIQRRCVYGYFRQVAA